MIPKKGFTNEEREAILNGEKDVSQSDILEYWRRVLLSNAPEIIHLVMKMAIHGKGKFGNVGIPTGKIDEKGKPIYELEQLSIKDRQANLKWLATLLLTPQSQGGLADTEKSQEEKLKELGIELPDEINSESDDI